MIAIFTLNVNEIDQNFIEAIQMLFKDKTIKITVEDILEERTSLTPKKSQKK